jgi:formylglycine-generating enzyme required for sulfatase activity
MRTIWGPLAAVLAMGFATSLQWPGSVAGIAAPRRLRGPLSVTMVQIHGGCFALGGKLDAKGTPLHRACLSPYWMDLTEVTVEQYARCVASGRCTAPTAHDPRHRWFSRCNWGYFGRENHPINCVTWRQARDYCQFVGKRLPTEIEWEYSATGPQYRKYPWGWERPDCTRANILDLSMLAPRTPLVLRVAPHWIEPKLFRQLLPRFKSFPVGCGWLTTDAVGNRPKGKSYFGLLDMGGNVGEWVKDCFDADLYLKCTPQCNNYTSPESCGRQTDTRSIRGGGFVSRNPRAALMTDGRAGFQAMFPRKREVNPSRNPWYWGVALRVEIGFRCAANTRVDVLLIPVPRQ